MAEQGGFLRRMFSFGQKPAEGPRGPDVDRRAEPENLVAAPDIGSKAPASPDNDMHHPAAASTDTDTEAGADASETSTGRTEPLNPAPPPSSAAATAEKKTLN